MLDTSNPITKFLITHPPALHSPIPPGQARTNLGSANNETGLKVPEAKYGPTGPVIVNNVARAGGLTPSVAC